MDNQIWTVKAALDWTVGYLERKGDEHPRRSAEWLLSAATGLSRVELYAFFDRPLSLDERDVLREGVKRRGAGEPLQYVTGEMAFRHMVVSVQPGVLIPRPETEVLVDQVISEIDAQKRNGVVDEYHVLDLCTGSGCIALSILYERDHTTCVATDISETAVECARVNASKYGLEERLTLCLCDLDADVDEGQFDCIVSNPPYIPSALLESLPREVVGFEPSLALDGGGDGLDIFRRIVELCDTRLKQGGILACELHETHLHEAAALCEHFSQVDIISDLTGRERILFARK